MDITHVEIIEAHTVRLRFEDGTEKTIDLGPYLYGPVFEAIRSDPAVFATVREALAEVLQAQDAWLESGRAHGGPVPPPRYRPAIYAAG